MEKPPRGALRRRVGFSGGWRSTPSSETTMPMAVCRRTTTTCTAAHAIGTGCSGFRGITICPCPRAASEAAGGGGGGAQTVDIFHNGINATWPLIRFLMDDPVYRATYRAHVEDLLATVFEPSRVSAILRVEQARIAPFVIGAEGEDPARTFAGTPAAIRRGGVRSDRPHRIRDEPGGRGSTRAGKRTMSRSAVVWRTAVAVFICTMCVKPAHAQPTQAEPSSNTNERFEISPRGYVQFDWRGYPDWTVATGSGRLEYETFDVRRAARRCRRTVAPDVVRVHRRPDGRSRRHADKGRVHTDSIHASAAASWRPVQASRQPGVWNLSAFAGLP